MTVELCTVVGRWAKEFEANHPTRVGPEKDPHVKRGNRDAVLKHSPMGAISYLEFWSGVPERRIRGILNKETKFTSLTVVDKLLNAMDLNYLLEYELHVVPNPQWSQAKWNAWAATCEEDEVGVHEPPVDGIKAIPKGQGGGANFRGWKAGDGPRGPDSDQNPPLDSPDGPKR